MSQDPDRDEAIVTANMSVVVASYAPLSHLVHMAAPSRPARGGSGYSGTAVAGGAASRLKTDTGRRALSWRLVSA
jgi:hypothetical protein